jgi:hypothetical protein
MFPHLLIVPYSKLYQMKRSCCWWLWLQQLDLLHPNGSGCSCVILRIGTTMSFKRSNMIVYSEKKSIRVLLHHSMSHIKKALFCLCGGLQSLYYSKEDISNLIILYTTNAVAWISVYSNYLPAPVKVAWVILSSYYRRAFVVADNPSRKNQAASI